MGTPHLWGEGGVGPFWILGMGWEVIPRKKGDPHGDCGVPVSPRIVRPPPADKGDTDKARGGVTEGPWPQDRGVPMELGGSRGSQEKGEPMEFKGLQNPGLRGDPMGFVGLQCPPE